MLSSNACFVLFWQAYFVNGLFGNNLRLKMDLLVGVGECALRNPPWVLCCLIYSDNASGSREFRILGTRLCN